MLKKFKKEDPIKAGIEEEIISNLNELGVTAERTSDEYGVLLNNVERLEAIRQKNKKSISPDTVAVVAGNLIGILLILGYEKKDIITSKALGFVLKGRV